MTLFAFRCECGNTFDELVPRDERNDPVICPECGRNAQRVLSPVGFSMIKYPRWFPTVGEWCESEADFHRKATRTKKKMEKENLL